MTMFDDQPSAAPLPAHDFDASQIAEAIARGLMLSIYLRDPAIGDHCRMVGEISGEIATAMGFSAHDARRIVLGGRLHDLGKIAIPDRILHNTDDLSPRQLTIVRAHAEHGERVLIEMAEVSEEVAEIARIVGAHHERFDGRGYPRGLVGLTIPQGSRIVAVADAYSAITMKRTYQPALHHDHALEQIRAGAGSQFDPTVVEAFLSLDWSSGRGQTS